MQIGKIAHARCGEPDGHTYVVIPDGMSEADYRTAVRKAVDTYQNELDKKDVDEPVRDYFGNVSIAELRKRDPNTSVGDYLREKDERKQKWDEWFAEQEKRRRSFGEHLKDQGLNVVQWHDEYVETHADWGHRHGVKIRYDGIIFRDPLYEEED